jgi:DHA1 family bicyclomycin/chloramphenicol resistance-like MFS transporter
MGPMPDEPAPPAATAAASVTAPVTSPRFRPAVRDVLVLGSMAALHAMSVDMYLPSLPDVAVDLHTTVTAAQLTMTAMLVGAAAGQLVVGPVSDRFGRRRPALVGIAFHVVLSLACAVVTAIWPLVALRAGQGFFVAATNVVAMASIRDRFVGADAAKLMSRLMLVIGVAPLFAPSIGGLIAGVWGWRAVFVALAMLGVALGVVVWRFLPETLPQERRRPGGLRAAAAGYVALLRDRHFVGLALLPGLTGAVLMSYVVASPFVLRTGYGLTQQQFALVFAANGVGLVLGAQVNAALVHRFAPLRILRASLVLTVALCVVLFVLAVTGAGGLPALLVVLWLTLSLINLVAPNANALALSRHGEVAGTAAAVGGAVQVSLSAAATPLSGLLGGDARAMATVMVCAAVLGVVVLAVATPAFRRGLSDEPATHLEPPVPAAPAAAE